MNKYIILPSSLMVALDGNPYVIESSHKYFEEIRNKLLANDFNIHSLIDATNTIKEYSSNVITVEDGVVYYNGTVLLNGITSRILDMYNNGDDFSSLQKFLEKVVKNPNPDIMNQISYFLEGVHIPIGKDGCLYAYKTIRENYKDIHSGTIDNSVGKVVSVDRESVDANNNIGCSHGLHCGNIEYVKKYSNWNGGTNNNNRLVIVRVEPENIVSVPKDESYMKIRCCEYKVVSEVTWDYLLNTTVQNDLIGQNVISIAHDELPVSEDTECFCDTYDENSDCYIDDEYEDNDYDEVPLKTPETGLKWTTDEDNMLIKLIRQKMTYTAISTHIGRSAEACRKRWKRLNN